jgi:hypothetical protein
MGQIRWSMVDRLPGGRLQPALSIPFANFPPITLDRARIEAIFSTWPSASFDSICVVELEKLRCYWKQRPV